jgi:hypothetical protein
MPMSYDRRNIVRKVLLLSPLAALLSLAGCFKHSPEVTQTPISIAISNNVPATIGIGGSVTIVATVYDQNSQGVVWSASPVNFGGLSNSTFDASTLTATVRYTPPSVDANPTKVTVTATSITNPNVSASVTFRFSPITISLQNFGTGSPLAPLTLNPNDVLFLNSLVSNDNKNSAVTWSISPASVGTLFTFTSSPFRATYLAPPSVSAATTVIVTATSKTDSTVTASQKITILPSGAAPNVVMLNVNGGPVPGRVFPNRAFTSILLCEPGSYATFPTCQTIDGILVDTGSYGLRILDSQTTLLKLPGVTDQAGNILENCASWPDGSYLWGPVSKADVYIGGEIAGMQGLGRPLVIQVISSAPTVVPSGCSNGGTTSDNTPELLGANGILGIGPEPTDCTVAGVNYCDGSTQATPPNLYYACPSSGCTSADSPVLVNALLQVSNPITSLDNNGILDNNGLIIQLPAVADPQASAMGTLTFGIGTQSNNSFGNATILTLDKNDNFTTLFNGQTLTNSFIDSGSSGLLFPDDSLPSCTVNQDFYCPTSPVMLSATNVGTTQAQSTVNFTVEDADSLLFAFGQDSVFPTIAGPSQIHGPCAQQGALCVFDWGLPFFYGRKVYELIDGQGGPWWAY